MNTRSSPLEADEADATGGRRFKCRACQRRFNKSEHLARHERSHLQQKPFSCPKCDKSFGRKDVLARHSKLHEAAGNTVHPSSPGNVSSLGNEDVLENSPMAPFSGHESSILATPTAISEISAETQPAIQQSPGGLPPSWNDSGDMLDLLMSDFQSTWPVTLPMMHFRSSNNQHASNSTLPGVESQPTDIAGTPGQEAMEQMSRLIAGLFPSLTAEIDSTGITSAFLDNCMYVFFERFTPSFPVLHRATFSTRESSHPLLLNIIALGSLFIGAKDAIAKGEALWRLAHTAVATSWQALMATRGPRDQCNGVQLVLTALLGQTYAILSKNESLRMTSQIFHGLGFYWARQCGMYEAQQFSLEDIPDHSAPDIEKNDKWKAWAACEVQNRAILGHYVLDGQISQFSGHAACARHVTNSLLGTSSDTAFAAATADEWISEMQKQTPYQSSFQEIFVTLFSLGPGHAEQSLSNFSVRVVLEGLQSLASDVQDLNGPAVGTPSKKSIAKALVRLYDERLEQQGSFSVENMELLVRWHSICLNLAAPATKLCRKICAIYNIPQNLHEETKSIYQDLDLRSWSQSSDARRALLHAMAIQEIVESLPLGRSHAIHLPAAIFAAATIYSARCLAGFPTVRLPDFIRWQDVWEVDIYDATRSDGIHVQDPDMTAFLQGNYLGSAKLTVPRNLMYDLNALQITLGSISSRWGVSHEMDEVLHRWIRITNEGAHSNLHV